MLYTASAVSSPEYFVLEIIFTEPVFLFLLLLIPAGIYLFRKELALSKVIGFLSIIVGGIYRFSKLLYQLAFF